MLLNRDGKVFVGRRIEQTVEGWQMPQGGIDDGEEPAEAALRELEEEIGTNKAEILREHPDWLCYDLPHHLLGVALHGKLSRPEAEMDRHALHRQDADIDVATEEPEFAEWKWLAHRCAAAADRAVQARHLCQGDRCVPRSCGAGQS